MDKGIMAYVPPSTSVPAFRASLTAFNSADNDAMSLYFAQSPLEICVCTNSCAASQI